MENNIKEEIMGWCLVVSTGDKIELTDREKEKISGAFSKGEIGRPFRVLDNGSLVAVAHIVCIKESGISANPVCPCDGSEIKIVYKLDKNEKKTFWKQCVKCGKLMKMVSASSIPDLDAVPLYEGKES